MYGLWWIQYHNAFHWGFLSSLFLWLIQQISTDFDMFWHVNWYIEKFNRFWYAKFNIRHIELQLHFWACSWIVGNRAKPCFQIFGTFSWGICKECLEERMNPQIHALHLHQKSQDQWFWKGIQYLTWKHIIPVDIIIKLDVNEVDDATAGKFEGERFGVGRAEATPAEW